jgi:GTPase Era involved in 16S rRNA processing
VVFYVILQKKIKTGFIKSWFVNIIESNVGKSTQRECTFVGERLSIITSKAQTTDNF